MLSGWYCDGDGQWTVSLISRHTWPWKMVRQGRLGNRHGLGVVEGLEGLEPAKWRWSLGLFCHFFNVLGRNLVCTADENCYPKGNEAHSVPPFSLLKVY